MKIKNRKFRDEARREEIRTDGARFSVAISKLIPLVVACVGLSGCDLKGAPSYSLFGAFFPASLLCAAIGLVSSLILRSVLIATGLEDVMPVKLLVYLSAAAAIALWLWLTLFGERW